MCHVCAIIAKGQLPQASGDETPRDQRGTHSWDHHGEGDADGSLTLCMILPCRSAGANSDSEQQQVVADSGQALVTAMSKHDLLLGGFTFEYSDEPWKGQRLPPTAGSTLASHTLSGT